MGNNEDVRGLLLAGGRSTRMGRDKRLLPIDGEPMVARAYRALDDAFGAPWVLVAGKEDIRKLAPLLGAAARFLPDRSPDAGPLAAMADALERLDRPFAFLLATDVPGMDAAALIAFDRLRSLHAPAADATVALSAEKLQVTCGFYRRSLAPIFRASIREGSRCLSTSLRRPGLRVHTVSDQELGGPRIFENLNTPDDHRRFIAGQRSAHAS